MVELLAEELSNKLNELHEFTQTQEWKSLSRPGFIQVLNESIDKVQELHQTLMEIDKKLEKYPSINKPSLEETLKYYGKTLSILQNNLLMEKEKDTKEPRDYLLNNQIELPEMYSGLQQKIMELLLKTRFLAERIHFHSKTERTTPLQEKETMQKLIQLLKTKETEIDELKAKYQNIKHQEILAKLSDKTVHDIEQELNELSRKLEHNTASFKKELLTHRKQLDFVNDSHAVLHQKSQLMDEITGQFLDKSQEVITLLKKEKDYEKQLVMEIENETLKLRGLYSRELLNLEQDKMNSRTEAFSQVQKKLQKLETELKDKDALLKQFQKLIEEKEKQLDSIKTKQSIRKNKNLNENFKKH